MCGCVLRQGRKHKQSAAVDHMKSHKGDERAFFCLANLQSLCKECHDGIKSQDDKRGHSTEIGLDGFPVDPDHPFYKGGAG